MLETRNLSEVGCIHIHHADGSSWIVEQLVSEFKMLLPNATVRSDAEEDSSTCADVDLLVIGARQINVAQVCRALRSPHGRRAKHVLTYGVEAREVTIFIRRRWGRWLASRLFTMALWRFLPFLVRVLNVPERIL
jgi:hypothetical protein